MHNHINPISWEKKGKKLNLLSNSCCSELRSCLKATGTPEPALCD